MSKVATIAPSIDSRLGAKSFRTLRASRATPIGLVMEQRVAERWIDEGGHAAPQAVIRREMAAGDNAPSPRLRKPGRPHIVMAGGGVAGLETPLALDAPAADRVEHEQRRVTRDGAAVPFDMLVLALGAKCDAAGTPTRRQP